ncbi:MAG: hypothetical protein MJZ68_09190 [archaeon]|nr:hypothetical protein [archaeon]
MVAIPQKVLDLIADPASVKAFTTVSADGQPHSIVAGTIIAPAPDMMAIGKVLMKTSEQNIAANNKGAFLITKGMESYEVVVTFKASVDSGELFDAMNKNLEAIHLHASAVFLFDVVAVRDESAGPTAGTVIA